MSNGKSKRMKEYTTEIKYHKNQRAIFEDTARFKVIAKGRRFGLTKGMANYVIEQMLDGVSPILWVDTTYPNIQRYVERYFIPVLKTIPSKLWQHRQNISELRIVNSKCDFKSADKPENMEGFAYKLIILNEAGIILRDEKLWNETIRPMTLDYQANVIIGGTPKGKKNKSGQRHLFYELFERGRIQKSVGRSQKTEVSNEEANSALYGAGVKGQMSDVETKNNNWKSFRFSSYDNPLLDKAEIDELSSEISPSLRDQEIMGMFTDVDSEAIIKRDWFNICNEFELRGKLITGVYQSWDTAFKKNEENDYSVCTTWNVTKEGYWLMDVFRERVEFPELKRKVKELYERHKPYNVLIEDKASGQSLIQELERETRIPIKKINPDKDKIARVHAVTPLIESGRVNLVLEDFADKREMILNECEEFPNGQYDDIVDSISQFLNYAKNDVGETEKILTARVKRKKFY